MINADSETGPVRVAVLGGGIAALTAALALTDPARRRRYQVTVYQMGWRLGGKGASGRNAERGQRIEEHGIHVWFGFYDNAFRLLRGCYDALAGSAGWRTPEGRPVALRKCIGSPDGDAAFYPHHHYVVNERLPEGQWSKWPLEVPGNTLVPGDPQPVPPETSLAFVKIAEMLASIAEARRERTKESTLPPPEPPPPPSDEEERHFERIVWERLRRDENRESAAALEPEEYLDQALDGLAAPGLDDLVGRDREERLLDEHTRLRLRLKFTAWALRGARAALRQWRGVSEKMWRLYLSCDTFAAVATGLARDVFGSAEAAARPDLRALDDIDLREWLARHGADADVLADNPTVRFVYNSAFAFQDGDHHRPLIAAGAALRGILRLFLGYKGAFSYRMASGMGDVVFSPIYALLRQRGVEFKFFHRVDRLRVGQADGAPVIESIEITQQAQVAAGRDYDPLVWVQDLPCWPNQPRFEQIVDGERLAAQVRDGLNLEDPAASWDGEGPQTVLQRQEHFDHVVLGIPIAALNGLTEELRSHPTVGPRWGAMLDGVATTPTQAFQVWSRATLRDLGWTDPQPVLGTYQDPIDTYIDMTPALRFEERRAGDVRALSYFCGVFDRRRDEGHAAANDRAIDNAVEHLTTRCDYLWPALRTGGHFQWSLLADGRRGDTDRERFVSGQYARANVLPSDLYTLSLPGTTGHRLPSDAATRRDGKPAFVNLWLAGDWTDNPLNLGCIEGTVMSGLQAARGLTGDAITIIGEDDQYLWHSLGRGTRPLSIRESVGAGPPAAADLASGKSGAGESRAPTPTWGDQLASLAAAVAAYDRPRVQELCAALIARARDEELPPLDRAQELLGALRTQRYFDLMERVADAFIQAGRDEPVIWRQYAQALAEQGSLSAALVVLERILVDPRCGDDERGEAIGLTGRVHKQRYVNAPTARKAAAALTSALDAYRRGYDLPGADRWHGVNLVALLRRAERDGLALESPDTATLAAALAETIETTLPRHRTAWDGGILVQANLALRRIPAAIEALQFHLAVPGRVDAFAVASLLRQLVEVWQLTPDAEPGATMLPLLRAELLRRHGGRVDLTPDHLQRDTSHLQKVFGAEEAVSLSWYRTGLDRCRLVARVVSPLDHGGGSGFLVRIGDFLPRAEAPDEMGLLTNAHVLAEVARDGGMLTPANAVVRLEAAAGPDRSVPVHRVRRILWSNERLDATVARLENPPSFEPYPFGTAAPDPGSKARVYVIGHPQGGGMAVSLYDNLLIDWEDPLVHYRAATRPGSSGSPVFDRDWRLIALHHAGGYDLPRLRGQPGRYPANEGIWIEAIRRAIGLQPAMK